jgi:hypothetical protein
MTQILPILNDASASAPVLTLTCVGSTVNYNVSRPLPTPTIAAPVAANVLQVRAAVEDNANAPWTSVATAV